MRYSNYVTYYVTYDYVRLQLVSVAEHQWQNPIKSRSGSCEAYCTLLSVSYLKLSGNWSGVIWTPPTLKDERSF